MSVKLMNSLKIKTTSMCIYTIFSLYHLYYIAYANLSCIRILTSCDSLNELLMCRTLPGLTEAQTAGEMGRPGVHLEVPRLGQH